MIAAMRISALLALSLSVVSVAAIAAEAPPKPALAPSEIAAAAPKGDWKSIPASDVLVMDLTPGTGGKPRRVVIQLLPPPFAQGWVGNIRKLAAAHWWDGLAVTRVQDNYVAQWGDPDGEDAKRAKALPAGLAAMAEGDYTVAATRDPGIMAKLSAAVDRMAEERAAHQRDPLNVLLRGDAYGAATIHWHGWPLAAERGQVWPVHCYGMVGVGRGMSPDTGSGAELYTVIGHAPRHLDRNIALVGRVIEGIENLSSLPRGTGALGFYETPQERTGIVSIRLGNEVAGLPAYEYLSTESQAFARYADARANRRDPFFIKPAGGADVCNVPVPVRRVKA